MSSRFRARQNTSSSETVCRAQSTSIGLPSIALPSCNLRTGFLQLKQITRINHIGLRVKSLQDSQAFYEKLGFIFIVGPVGPEPVVVMEHPTGININFILNASSASAINVLLDAPDKHTGFTHIALEVTDLDSVQQELRAKQIPLSGGPITIPNGATFLFVRDPDENVIEFHQPADATK